MHIAEYLYCFRRENLFDNLSGKFPNYSTWKISFLRNSRIHLRGHIVEESCRLLTSTASEKSAYGRRYYLYPKRRHNFYLHLLALTTILSMHPVPVLDFAPNALLPRYIPIQLRTTHKSPCHRRLQQALLFPIAYRVLRLCHSNLV